MTLPFDSIRNNALIVRELPILLFVGIRVSRDILTLIWTIGVANPHA